MKISLNEYVDDCRHFTWGEVLWHNTWQVHCLPFDERTMWNLMRITQKLDLIRRHFGRSIQITSGWRCPVYNRQVVGGALRSAHMEGKALDFQVVGLDAREVRTSLLPMLGELDIRMEKHDGSWCHIDSREPGPAGRFFAP